MGGGGGGGERLSREGGGGGGGGYPPIRSCASISLARIDPGTAPAPHAPPTILIFIGG